MSGEPTKRTHRSVVRELAAMTAAKDNADALADASRQRVRLHTPPPKTWAHILSLFRSLVHTYILQGVQLEHEVARLQAKLDSVGGGPQGASPTPAKTWYKTLTPTTWKFGSSPADNRYTIGKYGMVVTQGPHTDYKYRGVVADGTGSEPMTSGVHYWIIEHEKYGACSEVFVGVCRPGIDLDSNMDFVDRGDTWLMGLNNWDMFCNSNKGTGMIMDPAPKIPEGSQIGLLLDLDNGGTLTMYVDNKVCGTIAGGLVGPLSPCISSGVFGDGKVVWIYGNFTKLTVGECPLGSQCVCPLGEHILPIFE